MCLRVLCKSAQLRFAGSDPHKTPVCYSAQTNTTPSFHQTNHAEGRTPGRGIGIIVSRYEAEAVSAADGTARLTDWA